MATRAALVLLLLAFAPACSPEQRGDDDSGGDDDDPAKAPDASIPDAAPDLFIDATPFPDGGGEPAGEAVVYAHTSNVLYRVDPDTLAVTQIAPFGWPMGHFDQMTDIAVDKDGKITGVSFNTVYSVDATTAACTYLAPLTNSFNGLSYVPGAGPEVPEMLVGTTLDGSVWSVDPVTGATVQVGNYGFGWTSSGDIVSVEGFGTVATVKASGVGPDLLARIDPVTFNATPIGTGTGVGDIWGLGFWKGKIFGFSGHGQFVLIDATTGVAEVLPGTSPIWWGAGVTTSAPIIR